MSIRSDVCMYTNTTLQNDDPSGLRQRRAFSTGPRVPQISQTVKDEIDQLDSLLQDLMCEVNRPSSNHVSDRDFSLSRTLVENDQTRVDAGYISNAQLKTNRHPIKLYRIETDDERPVHLRKINLRSPLPLQYPRPLRGNVAYRSWRMPSRNNHFFTGSLNKRTRRDMGYETDSSLPLHQSPICSIPETIVVCQSGSRNNRISFSADEDITHNVPITSRNQMSLDNNLHMFYNQHEASTRITPDHLNHQRIFNEEQKVEHLNAREIAASSLKSVNGAQDSTIAGMQFQINKSRDNIEFQSKPLPSPISDQHDVVTYFPPYVKENVQFWYKPKISRENAIKILRNLQPGSFIIRDSIGFPGAYGLALKVSKPPPHVQIKPGDDISNELVRHYLIEPTPKGVRLKGCTNEPTYVNLSALVYHHSLEPIALPCRLIIPETDCERHDNNSKSCIETKSTEQITNTGKLSSKALLERGAACHVIYIMTMEAKSIANNSQACQESINELYRDQSRLQFNPTIVHFRVSSKGITLTDVNKRIFFRRHYAVESVQCACADQDRMRYWSIAFNDIKMLEKPRCFGFVTKKLVHPYNLECHLFLEYDPKQPAGAIVNFITKVMLDQQQK